MSKYVLGIDIGGTNFRMGLVDEEHELHEFVRYKTSETFCADEADQSIDKFVRLIRSYMDEHSAYDVGMIVIGVPGWVSNNHSYVYTIAKVPGLDRVELGQIIEESVGIKTYVGNDINALLMRDIVLRDLDPDRNKTILGFYIGTGFGNALYINGEMYLGKHGVAAEIGHIPLYGVTDVCNCGAVGCVETRACGLILAKIQKERFPDLEFDELFVKHPDDPVLVQFVKDCALPIATEITLFDPDHVIIGGGVFRVKGFPYELFEKEIRDRTLHPLPAEDIEFMYSEDYNSNGVIGSGIIGHRIMKSENGD